MRKEIRVFAGLLLVLLLPAVMCSFASAEDILYFNYDFADVDTSTAIPFPDYLFGYQLPAGFSQTENPDGTMVEYIDEKGEVIIMINPTTIPSLDAAVESMKELYGEEIIPYRANINDLEAVVYSLYGKAEDEQVYYYTFAYFKTNNGTIVQFIEASSNVDRQGMYVGRIMPLVISGENVSSSEGTAGGTAGICTADKVNVRSEPAMNARSLGQINNGDKLTVLLTSGDWSRISCEKGEGWIRTQYIRTE